MKVNSDVEQLNMNVSSIGVSKVPFAAQIAQISSTKDSFAKGKTTNPVIQTKTAVSSLGVFRSPKLLLKVLLSEPAINKMVESNPNIKQILDEHGVALEINPNNLASIVNTHLTTTTAYALQIANNLNLSSYDKHVLEQASLFHDFGKVLIPSNILNKRDILSYEEKQIMDLHSELGYELLSQTGLNKTVLNLVRNHHKPSSDDLLAQILSVADMYSALREVRCYKKPLSNKEALEILDQKAQKGEVNTEVVEALKSSVPAERIAV